MKKQFTDKLLKPLLLLAALILICGFLARTLAKSETIVDYVNKNQAAAAEQETPDAGISSADGKAPEEAKAIPDAPASGKIRETAQANATETAYAEESAHIDVSKKETDGETIPMSQNTPLSDTAPLSQNDSENNSQQAENSIPANRTVYREGFYYEPLSEEIKARITGISYPVSATEALSSAVPVINILADDVVPAVTYDDLRFLSVLYYDFNGEVQTGELICNKGIADDLMEIFHELYRNEYRIEKIRLVDEYQADDTASITDNNTSCFNYRVVDGTTSLSKHALGCAIDINPFYNPYVVFNKNGSGETYISPPGSEIYVDRTKDFPYKIDESDLCYKLFTDHGFTWGGNWNSCKDYQHFQKVLD